MGTCLELCIWRKRLFVDARRETVEYNRCIVWSVYILSSGSKVLLYTNSYLIVSSLELLHLWILCMCLSFLIQILIDIAFIFISAYLDF